MNITAPVVLRYSVSNGSAPKSGNVTVSPHPLSADEPPSKFELRQARHPVAPLRVGVGGSVTAPVLTDWRDGDGDSLSLVGQPTVPAGGVAVVTADGGLRYTASSVGGPVAIGYAVSDGEGKTVSGTLSVLVGGPGDRFAPTPRPDVIQVTAGHSTTFYPLANDFPGVDQTNSGAALVLAGPINSSDLTVVTDTRTGSVTITPPTGAAQRSYPLDYVAGFGQAPTATGTIRVDVVSPGATTAPIAMPDVAVLRGQSPALVDVLANDYSPSGALLAVESASVVDDPGLQVAVQDSRWLRVSALATLPPGRTQIVNYVVTDGTQSVATGQVTVTQLPALDPDIPVTRDDSTIVRAGDIVSVPVLDNDADPNGDPLVLVQDVRDDSVPAGQLAVTGPDGKPAGTSLGTAFVADGEVRFLAPARLASQQTVTVTYGARNPSGSDTAGVLHVTINPDAPAADDNPPDPPQIEARVVAGDPVPIPIPTSGIDPDGDSVTVTGIGAAPLLGRVTTIGLSSLTYLAYPSSAGADPTAYGTDVFSYVVTDRYGKSGTGSIRVAPSFPLRLRRVLSPCRTRFLRRPGRPCVRMC